MADVFAQDNVSPVGVPSPLMLGEFIPSIDLVIADGMGLVTPWGGGPSTKRYAPQTAVLGGESNAQDDIQAMVSSFIPTGDTINIQFRGVAGPIGPAGPPGLPGLPPTVVPVNVFQTPSGVFENSSVPLMDADLTWTDNDPGAGSIAWTTFILKYQHKEYTITAGNSSNVYIYWDKGDTPTTLQGTDSLATALGANETQRADRWILAYNNLGVANAAFQSKIIHGGVIQASTITATQISALTITAAEIHADAITTVKINGLAVETLKIDNDATTIYEAVTTAGGIAFDATNYTEVQSDVIVSEGGVIQIYAGAIWDYTGGGSGTVTHSIKLEAAGNIIAEEVITGNAYDTGANKETRHSISGIWFPSSAGSVTIKLFVSVSSSPWGEAKERDLTLQESKGK